MLALAAPAVVTAACGSAPAARPLPPLVFGVNDFSWHAVSAATGRIAGWRAYAPPSTGVPRRWPGVYGGPQPPGVRVPIVSIKPDIAQVLSGGLDQALAAYFAQVPPGAWVTCWHEGERPSYGFTHAQIHQLHRHVYAIFRGRAAGASRSAPRARYGQIFSTYSSSRPGSRDPLIPWVVPGLDFYGLDGYQYQPGDTVDQVLAGPAAQVRAVVPGAALAITETNTRFGSQAGWFTQAYAVARQLDCLAMFGYFGTKRNYPWNPADAALISELSVINRASRAGLARIDGASGAGPASRAG